MTIDLECGFSSPSPFTRAFKLFYNVTPDEYRQRLVNT
ncbi:helix-turn-helix domain-containing protein [Agaribacterium sp. ZY112]